MQPTHQTKIEEQQQPGRRRKSATTQTNLRTETTKSLDQIVNTHIEG